jgi:hypothetical protein
MHEKLQLAFAPQRQVERQAGEHRADRVHHLRRQAGHLEAGDRAFAVVRHAEDLADRLVDRVFDQAGART